MPDPEIDPETPPETPPNPDIPAAAAQILEEVRKQAEKDAPATPPSSQPARPDAQAAWVAQRDDFKKKMGFNEEQMQLYERDRASAQAPVLLELAKMKVREGHKDYDQLKQAFETEVATYVSRGQVVNPELAEKIFLMVKGQELEAGRYTPPSSQPPAKGAPTPQGQGARAAARIAPGYNANDPGLSGGAPTGGEPEGQLSEREKVYAGVLGVDEKSYKKNRDDKEKGIREISDRSYRAPEIDVKTAGVADRDLASLWGRNGGKI